VEVVVKQPADRGQGVGLVPGPVAGEHQLVPQFLPQRMLGGGYCTLAALTPATLGDVVERK